MRRRDPSAWRAKFRGFRTHVIGQPQTLQLTEEIEVEQTNVRPEKWQAYWVRGHGRLGIELATSRQSEICSSNICSTARMQSSFVAAIRGMTRVDYLAYAACLAFWIALAFCGPRVY